MYNKDYILDEILSSRYDIEKKQLDNLVVGCNKSLLKAYKRLYPINLISQKHIKQFVDDLLNINLLPNREEYISLNKKNEFFDITISICIGTRSIILECPYPININKVTEFIRKNNVKLVPLEVSFLKELINQECFDEFDEHIRAKKEGLDLLDDIKSENPIIVLESGGIVKGHCLINGTHRTIQAIKEKKEVVEGYVVCTEVCQTCGMSKGYEQIYSLMLGLYRKVYGVKKVKPQKLLHKERYR